jgi:hypothetical protein
MIEITTLRLGNILLYKGEPHYVSMLSLDIDDEYQELIGVTPLGKRTGEKSDWIRAFGTNELTLAPITEEWLLKFGFAPYALKGWFQKEIEPSLSIHINSSMQLCLYAGQYIDGEGALIETIQYVHQLQNLYFSLTGLELTPPHRIIYTGSEEKLDF